VNEKILIVDDSAANREVYALLLEHFGYAVLKAADGWEGVRQAREHRPDLILMDVSMPVVDGIEATELLKVDLATRDIPVIGVSAHGDPATIARALAVGMECYLTKPTPPRQVLQEIERCLMRPERGAERVEPPALMVLARHRQAG
jgi:CheY-like chemotaxis protein